MKHKRFCAALALFAVVFCLASCGEQTHYHNWTVKAVGEDPLIIGEYEYICPCGVRYRVKSVSSVGYEYVSGTDTIEKTVTTGYTLCYATDGSVSSIDFTSTDDTVAANQVYSDFVFDADGRLTSYKRTVDETVYTNAVTYYSDTPSAVQTVSISSSASPDVTVFTYSKFHDLIRTEENGVDKNECDYDYVSPDGITLQSGKMTGYRYFDKNGRVTDIMWYKLRPGSTEPVLETHERFNYNKYGFQTSAGLMSGNSFNRALSYEYEFNEAGLPLEIACKDGRGKILFTRTIVYE